MYRFNIIKCQLFFIWDICPLNKPATCQLELPYQGSTLPCQYHMLEITTFTSELMYNIPFLWLSFGWYELQLTCRSWVSHSWGLIWVGPLWFFTLIPQQWSDVADFLLYNFSVLSDRKVSIKSRIKIKIKKFLEQ